MAYIMMAMALLISLLLIIFVCNNKNLIIPICIIYYFICVVNDIFNAGAPLEIANILDISYQLSDVLMFIFIGVLLVDIVQRPCIMRTGGNAILSSIVVLTGISLISGALQFGLISEWIGDLRTIGFFVAAILFFARFFNVLNISKYLKMLDVVMIVILLLSLILWGLDIFLGIHLLESQYNATLSDGGSTMRFIQSYQVLGLALYSLFLVNKDIKEKGIIGLKACLFILAVIMFQHRSIWLAMGLGLIAIIISTWSAKRITFRLFLECIIIFMGGLIVVLFAGGNIIENVRNGLELLQKMLTGSSLEGTTASTRVSVWIAVIEDLTGLSMVIGRPFGYGYAHSIEWNTSPHSGFIRLLGRTGYLGFCLFIILILYIAVKFIKGKKHSLAYLVCIIAFMYGYDFTWLCGVAIGCYIAVIKPEYKDYRIETSCKAPVL